MRLARRVDMQAWNPTLLDRVKRPLNHLRVDGLASRKTVLGRPIRRLHDEEIATRWLRSLRRESVDTVNVARVED